MGRPQRAWSESTLLLLTIAKGGLVGVIMAGSLIWVLWWILLSGSSKYLSKLDTHFHSRFFRTEGTYGSAFIGQSVPFVLVALLSYGVIELRKKIKLLGGDKGTREMLARPTLTTYPVVIRGPFGVVTAAEALCAAGLVFLILYAVGRPTYTFIQELSKFDTEVFTYLNLLKLAGASYYMGRTAMISFSLLWIPVSRGSPFLRLINVSFESAIKYHIWLSVLTLSMLTFHSVGYILFFALTDRSYEIFQWRTERESCAIVAGLVAWTAGLIMWPTSLSFVRRRWYEVFFGLHHLYIVFFIFLLYHVVSTVHVIIIPCLLFAVDRFLRMVQSRHSVDVLSAKIMESGALKLKIARSKSKGLIYNPLSSWYLQCPSLSRLMKFQWHFFSVTSTVMDGKEALCMVIKPLGNWTTRLRNQVLESVKGGSAKCPFSFKAAVEGPYGDDSDFFLRYNVIILIAGGIGVTPLLAVLQDILHRKRLGEDNLPSSIRVYHCVRTQEELCVLNSVDPNLILPDYKQQGLDIRVETYVTSPTYKSLQGTDHKDDEKTTDLATFGGKNAGLLTSTFARPISLKRSQSGPIRGICAISTSGDPKWMFLTIFASIGGFYTLWGLSNVLLVRSYNSSFPNYNRSHLIVASMVLGIGLFGGFIISLWWLHSERSPNNESGSAAITEPFLAKVPRKTSSPSSIGGYTDATHLSATNNHHQHEVVNGLTNDIENASSLYGSPWNGTLHLRSRPQWREIFQTLNNEYQGENIAVLVSGPESMQADIAKECQRHTRILKRSSSSNTFHLHSISFNV